MHHVSGAWGGGYELIPQIIIYKLFQTRAKMTTEATVSMSIEHGQNSISHTHTHTYVHHAQSQRFYVKLI